MNARCALGFALVGLSLAALACNLTASGQQVPTVMSLPGAEGAAGTPSPGTATYTPVILPAQVETPTASQTPPPSSPLPSPSPEEAQAVSCETIITQAIDRIDEVCAGTGRNEACYGHQQVMVTLHPGASGAFSLPGDRIAVASLARLTTSPYDPAGGQWGIALLRLQANLPETLPGQAVTVIAYGDTSIADAGGTAPMQAVTVRTGLGGTTCEAMPESGLLIQNDTQEVASLVVNGVELSIGSTVLVQAQPGRDMTLAVLEGRVDALALGQLVAAVAGSQVRIPLGGGPDRLLPLQPPRLEALDPGLLQRGPINALLSVLPQRISIPQPLQNLDLQLPPLLATRLPGPLLGATSIPLPTFPPFNLFATRPPLLEPTSAPSLPLPALEPTRLPLQPLPVSTSTPTTTPTLLPLNLLPRVTLNVPLFRLTATPVFIR